MSVQVVAHPQTNLVITPSTKTPGYGTFRVDSVHKSLENGFVNVQKRSAFIRGKIEDLNDLGLTAGMNLPGMIVKKESYQPFYEGQSPKINPTTSEVILTNGRETFLEYSYTNDANACDQWVGETALEVTESTASAMSQQEV